MSQSARRARRRRLSIEPLEPRRLLDVSGVWEELGFRSASGGGITHDGQNLFEADPAATVTPEGNAVVAFEGAGGIQVRYFDGFTWLSLDDSGSQRLPSSGGGRSPDIAADHLGNLYVSWLAGYGTGADAFLVKGSLDRQSGQWTWSGLGGSTDAGGLSDDSVENGQPALAVGVDGLPVVAYSAYDAIEGDMDVVAKKYIPELDAWIELAAGAEFTDGGGGVSNDAMNSGGTRTEPETVDIAIGGDNAPIVVWTSSWGSLSTSQIYARRWNAVTSTWEKIGGESAADPAQAPVGGLSDSPNQSTDPQIAIRPDPDQPDKDIVYVAWRDYEDLDHPDVAAVYVKELADPRPVLGAWDEVSPGSAGGDGILGRHGHQDLSLDIGDDGLPLIGLTRLQVATDELAADTTPPWSGSNVYNDHGPQAANWYAWGYEAYEQGGSVAWRWLGGGPDGATAKEAVTQARDITILALPDGSPLLLFGENLLASANQGISGGPWDPGSFPYGVADSEIYALRWDEASGQWTDYGDGSGSAGGVDAGGITWNSDPQLATAGDGRSLMAYTERLGNEMFVRVNYYDDDTGDWLPFGTGLETGFLIDEAELENHTYRWDEVVIGSDPFVPVGIDGRPVVAYLDIVNTDDATVEGRSTIKAWAYDEATDSWISLEDYAYVTDGTVWDGYLVDQLELIAGPGDTSYLAWRNVDPTRESGGLIPMVHPEDVMGGSRMPYDPVHGASEIFLQEWDADSDAWVPMGGDINPFDALPQSYDMNFDPSLVMTGDQHIWVAFTIGWPAEDPEGTMAKRGALLSDIFVYEFDPSDGNWAQHDAGLPLASEVGQSYAHPQLAVNQSLRPVLAFEEQTWSLNSLFDMGLLADGAATGATMDSRPLWNDDEELMQWRIQIPEAVELEGLYNSSLYDRPKFTNQFMVGFQVDKYSVFLPHFSSLYSSVADPTVEIVITDVPEGFNPIIGIHDGSSWSDPLFEVEATRVEAPAAYKNTRIGVFFTISDPEFDEPEPVTYSVEVRWVFDGFIVQDRFQELTSSVVRTASYDSGSWTMTDDDRFVAPEGRAYVLPEIVGGGSLEPVLTYTSLELATAGFPSTEISQYRYDYDNGWGIWEAYYNYDLGMRSYFNGDHGGQGDGFTQHGWYSDLAASYFNPRIMYGARHMDFEYAWWRTMCGYGTPQSWWTIINGNGAEYSSPGPRGWGEARSPDDYRAPIPGDTSPVGSSYNGFRADGHVPATSYVHAWQDNGLDWEQLNGQGVESGTDDGLNARTDGQSWSPGFISTAGIRGAADGLIDDRVVVAWNYIEKNLVHVRQFRPESALPSLAVSETSGTLDDDKLVFGRLQTGQDATETIVVQNTGSEDLFVQEIRLAGSDAFSVTDLQGNTVTGPFTVAPGSGKILQVHVQAVEPGPLYGTMYVITNDPLAAPLKDNRYGLALVGDAYSGANVGISEDVGITGDLAVPFDLVTPGQNSYRTFTIDNTGSAPLNVDLGLVGLGEGFSIVGDAMRTIAAGESEEVQVLFQGNPANQDGALGYVVVRHDDYGNADGWNQYLDRTYVVTLVGNMPSLINPVQVGSGNSPSLTLESIAYNNGSGQVNVDGIGGLTTTASLDASGDDRPRSDGDFTVYVQGGALVVYDRVAQQNYDLSTPLGLFEVAHPNIEDGRIVFSAVASGSRDIHLVDLNLNGQGRIVATNPVADHTHIADINPAGREVDDYPDVSGDWVVWRRGDSDGEYSIYSKDLATGIVLQVSVGQVSGPRIPTVSGDRVVWVESVDGSRVVLYDRDQGSSVLFGQQGELGDEIAMSGDLLVWSAKQGGNDDLFGYFLPTGTAGPGVDTRGRKFQLTFSSANELAPDVWGSWIAWQAGSGSTVHYASLSAAADIMITHEGAELVGGDTIDFDALHGDMTVDIDGRYVYRTSLQIANVGTGILDVANIVPQISSGNAVVEIELPPSTVIHQGGEPIEIGLVIRATDDGPVTGTLDIYSSDPLDTLLTLNLTGTAVEPTLTISDQQDGSTALTTIDFGTLLAGESASTEFYLVNTTGDSLPLVVGDLLPNGPDLTVNVLEVGSGAFVNGKYVLDPTGYLRCRVTWSPAFSVDTLGPLDTTLDIESNDVENPGHAIQLVGTAIGRPDLAVLPADGQGAEITTLDFGEVLSGEFGYLSFMVRNDGLLDLNVNTMSIAGTTVFAFDPAWGGAYDLTPGESQLFTVRFSPSSVGSVFASLAIESNDPDSPTYLIGLTGEGIFLPDITLLDGADVLTSGSTYPLTTTTVGQDTSIDLTIRNDGGEDLNLTGWSLTPQTGTPAGVFGVPAFPGSLVLLPGQETDITVTFTPQANQNYAATLSLESDDPDEMPYVLNLIAQGTAPVAALSDQTVAFDKVQLDETASLTMSLTNDGEEDLHIGSLASSDPSFSVALANPSITTLAPGESTALIVTFSPTALGTLNATLTIESNDPVTPAAEVDVTGIGIAGELTVWEASGVRNDAQLDFGNLFVGDTGQVLVTFQNTGEGTLNIASVVSDNPAFTLVPVSPAAVLQPTETLEVTVVFTPGNVQNFNGVITVTSNDPDESTFLITTEGKGVAGDIAVTESSGDMNDDLIVFPDRRPGQTASQVFTITNQGTGDLVITDYEIDYAGTSDDLGAYAVNLDLDLGPVVIKPNHNLLVEVAFSPVRGGAHDATLRLLSDDPDESPYPIQLSGVGIEPDIIVLNATATAPVHGLAFAPTKVGTTSERSVIVRNDGTGDLNLDTWYCTHAAYSIEPANGSTMLLQPGESRTFKVLFSPTADGDCQGFMRIRSDDPDDGLLSLALDGQATTPQLRLTDEQGNVNPAGLDFGEVVVDQTASTALVLHNDGPCPLVISSVTTTNGLFAVVDADKLAGAEVAPGGSRRLTVTFTPGGLSGALGHVVLNTDDANKPRVEIQVTGHGVPEPFPGDFTDDGQTDWADFDLFETAFGKRSGIAGYNPDFDLAGPDGVIDFADLGVFADLYGKGAKNTTKGIGLAGLAESDATLAVAPELEPVQPALFSYDASLDGAAGADDASTFNDALSGALFVRSLSHAAIMGMLPTSLGEEAALAPQAGETPNLSPPVAATLTGSATDATADTTAASEQAPSEQADASVETSLPPAGSIAAQDDEPAVEPGLQGIAATLHAYAEALLPEGMRL